MRAKRWIVLSLVLNVALAAAAWHQLRQARRAEPTVVLKPVRNAVPAVTAVEQSASIETNTVNASFHWSQVESDNYEIYIANLRAIGCPAPTIRNIILADVNALYDEKAKAVADEPSRRFWEWMLDEKKFGELVSAKAEELKQLQKEREALIETLLPTDSVADSRREQLEERSRQFGFLPADKLQALCVIDEEYEAELRRIGSGEFRLSASVSPEKTEEQARLEAWQRRDARVRELLTAEEYSEFQLRGDGFAVGARDSLADLNVTEQEVRRIAELRQKRSNDLGEIRALLGEERYADYLRAQDPNYSRVLAVVEHHELPEGTAKEIHDMRKTAEAQAKAIRSDETRSPEDRLALLEEIRRETERSFSALLGPTAFRTYQMNSGDWIDKIGK